jgi:hypothetical protein
VLIHPCSDQRPPRGRGTHARRLLVGSFPGEKIWLFFPKNLPIKTSIAGCVSAGLQETTNYEENRMLHLGMSLGIDDLRRAIAPMQRFCFPAVTLLTAVSFYPDVFACMVLTAARKRLSAFFPGNDSSVE